MNFSQEYQRKLTTAEEAVKVVKSGDWIDYSFGTNMPDELDRALAARAEELDDVKVRAMLTLHPLAILDADPEGEHFCYNTWHFTGYERKLPGRAFYLPMNYRHQPIFYEHELDLDVAMTMVAPMDRYGYFNFSLTNSSSLAICRKAKTLIVEVNEKMPRALGGREESIHISEVDFIVEGSNPDLPTIPAVTPTETDLAIAKRIVEEIPDGASIQLGIGGLPNAVGSMLARSDKKDLGMHTEMMVDAYLELYRAGKLTNRRKTLDRDKGTWTFAIGSQELYDWIDDNPGLASYPVNYTNDPAIMAANDNLISINSCLEVDLFGQVSAESAGTRHISGTGGQLDFLTGAYRSRGGKAFICFNSTHTDRKTGKRTSRVRPTLAQGTIVTDPRTQAHILVTECGMAKLTGLSTWERAEALISIAHPDFKDELINEAQAMNIWRRTNRIR